MGKREIHICDVCKRDLPFDGMFPKFRGEHLHRGEAQVVVAFTVDELEDLAYAAPNPRVARRLACALGLLDADRERAVREVLAEVHG